MKSSQSYHYSTSNLHKQKLEMPTESCGIIPKYSILTDHSLNYLSERGNHKEKKVFELYFPFAFNSEHEKTN